MPNRRPIVTFTMQTPEDHRRSMIRQRLARAAYVVGILAAIFVPSPLCAAIHALTIL